MFGAGLRHAAFVADQRENAHWMLDRLLKRARGLDRSHFFFIDQDDPDLAKHVKAYDIKVLIPLGESALRRMVGESDMIRWRGRVVPHYTGVWQVPTFAPSKLLPQRKDPSNTDIMRQPQRFHGVFCMDVLKALDIAKDGFTRHAVNYLLDPDP